MARTLPGQEPWVVRIVEGQTGQKFGRFVKARLDAGHTFRQIGAEVGVSYMSIWRHWKKLERSQRPVVGSERGHGRLSRA
jgi:hypothetical protein